MGIDHDDSTDCSCIVCDMRDAIFGALIKHDLAVELTREDGTKVVRIKVGETFYEALAVICAEALAGNEDTTIADDFYEAVDAYLREMQSVDEDESVHLVPAENENDEIVDEPISMTKH